MVGEDEVTGAIAAARGLILAANDGKGVEAGAQVAALLGVPGERRAAAEKVSPAAIRRDTSSRTRRRRP